MNISNEEANVLLNYPKQDPIDKEAITDLKQKICERDECIMELVKKINKIEKCVQSLQFNNNMHQNDRPKTNQT